MKIGVCVKPVLSTDESPKVSGNNVDLTKSKLVVNPYDEYAIEAALEYKDKNAETEVVSLSYSLEQGKECIYSALAMGIDKALFINQKEENSLYVDSFQVAGKLYEAVRESGFDLILSGKEASDTQNGAVNLMLAKMLGWPCITNVNNIEFEDNGLVVERVTGNGVKESLKVSLPCVISVTKGINKPRYADLFGIMNARSKPFEEVPASDDSCIISVGEMRYFQKNTECVMISGDEAESSKELVRVLSEEYKVI